MRGVAPMRLRTTPAAKLAGPLDMWWLPAPSAVRLAGPTGLRLRMTPHERPYAAKLP